MICRNIVWIFEKNHHNFTTNEYFILNIAMLRGKKKKEKVGNT